MTRSAAFEDVLEDVTSGNTKTLQSDYQPVGRYPVVDQGQDLIAGYIDNETALCGTDLPVIVFGDHTKTFKFIDFPFCVGADGTKVLRPKNGAHLKYVFHYLRTLKLPDVGYSRHYKFLKRFEIPLPPLAEQRRIAAILDAADALRQKRRQALRLLDQLSQAIFIEMFGDPVANPRGWKLRRLGDIGILDRGVSKHRPRNAPELLGGVHPFIQTGDVANCNGYIRTFANTYSDLGLRQSKKWPAGVLCITIAANIAKTGILTFDACFPDSVVGFQPGDETTTEYVQVWLSFLQKTLEATAPESAQKNINLEILRKLMIPLPPLERQREFSRARTAVARLRDQQVRGEQIEDALFASLQHRAFRGEL